MKKTCQLAFASLLLFASLLFVSCNNDKPESATGEDPNPDQTVFSIDPDEVDKMVSDTSGKLLSMDSSTIMDPFEENDRTADTVRPRQKQVQPENILRIEGVVKVGWKGVTGCCEQNTVNSQVRKGIEQWVGMQILANRPNLYYRSGVIGKVSLAYCKFKTTWDGKRSCSGSWVQKYYIEFIKQ